jgi:hypothetical protein
MKDGTLKAFEAPRGLTTGANVTLMVIDRGQSSPIRLYTSPEIKVLH